MILGAWQEDTGFCWCCPCQGQNCHWKLGIWWGLGWLRLLLFLLPVHQITARSELKSKGWDSPPRSPNAFLFPALDHEDRFVFLFVLFCLCLLVVLAFIPLLYPVWEHLENKRKPRNFCLVVIPHVLRFLAVCLLPSFPSFPSASGTLSAYFWSRFYHHSMVFLGIPLHV